MASLDNLEVEEQTEAADDMPVSMEDVELVTRTAIKMLKDGGGLETIKKALDTSTDPGMVIGQFLVQLIGGLGEQMGPAFNLDPRVFLAKNGFLDHILDWLEEQLDLPRDFSDQVYGEVLELVKAAAQNNAPPPNEVMGPPGSGPGVQGQAGPPPAAGPGIQGASATQGQAPPAPPQGGMV